MPAEGVAVYEGEEILYKVRTNAGSMVEQWDNGTSNIFSAAKTYPDGRIKISGNVNVKAYLIGSSQYEVAYVVMGGNGSLSATADGDAFDSLSKVSGGSELVFTTVSDAGYMVDHWTVTNGKLDDAENTEAVTADGAVLVDPTFTIDGLRDYTVVRVYFKELATNPVAVTGDAAGTAAITYVTPLDAADTGARDNVTSENVRDGGTVKLTLAPTVNYVERSSVKESIESLVNSDAIVEVSKNDDGVYSVVIRNLCSGLNFAMSDIFEATYTVSADDVANGSITVSTGRFVEGETINVTVTVNNGYALDRLMLNAGTLDQPVDAATLEYTFKMPAENVTVTAELKWIGILASGQPKLGRSSITYGEKLGEVTLSGVLHDDVNDLDVEGTFSWNEPDAQPDAGAYQAAWSFEPDDTALYRTASDTIELTVNKATPFGAPNYTAIYEDGKTLADAAINADGDAFSVEGSVKWVDADGNELPGSTVVNANVIYNWVFTPASANYSDIGGRIVVYRVSAGGGGGASSESRSYAVTVEKAENGTVTVNPSKAEAGAAVRISVKPAEGYKLDKIRALDANSNELVLIVGSAGEYSFVMPESRVTVSAGFVKIEEEKPVEFADVKAEDYYFDAVQWAAKNGITDGITEDHFGSDMLCTRAQIITFLWRAAGSPEPKNSENPFADFDSGDYYFKAVLWAIEQGITNGTSEDRFSPDDTCTRAQSAAFLYRAAGSPEVDGESGFVDVESEAYYAAAVAWAEKNGITEGIGNDLFGTDHHCTRAQIVTFLYRSMAK